MPRPRELGRQHLGGAQVRLVVLADEHERGLVDVDELIDDRRRQSGHPRPGDGAEEIESDRANRLFPQSRPVFPDQARLRQLRKDQGLPKSCRAPGPPGL